MSFLSGMFLLALPLAAVPVVLHLYRRRQRTVIPWGAMQFLASAAKEGSRRERWEEIVLMLLRAAAVIALVLALARPQLSGRWFGAQATREVILVLDDSMSMARDVADETPYLEMCRKAEEILAELTSNDVVQVMAAVGGPRWLTSEAIRADASAKRKLLSQIQSLQPTEGAADLFSCVQAAITVEPSPGAQARHVVLLSDAQVHGWRIEALAAWRRLRDVVEASSLPMTVQAISCGFDDAPVDNLAVTAMEASLTQVGVREQVAIRVDVQNMGDTPAAATTLTTFANDDRLEEIEVPPLAVGETTTLEGTWQGAEPGVYMLSCRLQSVDQLSRDDSDAVIVEVVGTIPVFIVEATEAYRQRVTESTFFTAALGYEGATPYEAWHSVFAPRPIPVDQLATTPLGEYRAIVITDLQPLVSDSVERLREFVERGGGLWVSLGRRADRDAFNAVWYDDGDGLSPLPLDQIVTHIGNEQQEAVIHPPSADHIATAHLSDTNRLDIDTVRIKTRHRFEPPARGQELSVLLETGDGEPLVVENFVGRGRVILQAIPWDVGWSNLPLTKAHVVMVQDWLEYLTQPAATQFNLPMGGRIELSLAPSSALDTVTMTLPDGSEKPLSRRDDGDAAVYRYSQTQVPGPYHIRFGESEEIGTIPFYVERDAKESDMRRLTHDQQMALNAAAGVQFPGESVGLIPPLRGGHGEKPIWNTLLAGLLILLAVELLLATRAARRRTPGPARSSTLEQDADLFAPLPTEIHLRQP